MTTSKISATQAVRTEFGKQLRRALTAHHKGPSWLAKVLGTVTVEFVNELLAGKTNVPAQVLKQIVTKLPSMANVPVRPIRVRNRNVPKFTRMVSKTTGKIGKNARRIRGPIQVVVTPPGIPAETRKRVLDAIVQATTSLETAVLAIR